MNSLRVLARVVALASVFVCLFASSASVTKGALASPFKTPSYVDPTSMYVLNDKPAPDDNPKVEEPADIPEDVPETEGEEDGEAVEEEFIEDPMVVPYTEEVYEESSDIYAGSPAVGAEDFQTAGIVYDEEGTRYTWYSEQVLPGGGLDIPGRYTDEEGFVRDENGNIVVASSDHEKGASVNTPFGSGVVYDTGCASGTVDIYVGW